ncbi:hypothetical protein KPL78_08605 [Roseomonas sp. HJA6]|uniref:Calcineurin-like phosphoesterase domain-containing protein n=1 Tax=Roseomonas alba TaxID=2846776 RepID=A0ABS7A6H9_9PROT|nr:hypothetical protein [Neoroseomonas alba]MBW6397902.1 hypothetical protein [Neoroseomonas alba]
MRIVLALIAALATMPAQAEPFRFVAFGDMPYCLPGAPQDCPAEEGRVARLMGDINAAQPAFTIFVGDTKGGSELCTDERTLRAFTWMGLANHPLVYTPGDNEWTDCWQDRAGRFDQLERLALLRNRFFRDARSLGRGMALTRQADADPAHAAYVENARWMRDGVVFATLHVVGSNNNRPTEPGERPASRPPEGAMAEFQARDAANLAWLAASFATAREQNARAVVIAMQAEMYYAERCGSGQTSGFVALREALAREAATFARPVLLIHGDIHAWLQDRPVPAAPNLTRIMVPGAEDVRAVVVTVDPEAAYPWAFRLIGPEDRVRRNPC